MKNILVVEDDPFTIDFYRFIFKKAGFNALIMEDGDKVVNTLNETAIHLIIMDINLKNTYLYGEKIDGIKLSKAIKSNDSISHIPILLVTAYTPGIKGENFCEACQAEDFITKPILDFNFLIEKVNSLIENNGQK